MNQICFEPTPSSPEICGTLRLWVVAGVWVCASPAWSQTLSPVAYSGSLYGELTSLGTLGGAASLANAVSSDGSVLVGYAKNAGADNRAFRWTAATGLQDLGTLGGATSTALNVTPDGQVIVGSASTATQNHAFRWTALTGMIDLGTLGGTASTAHDVSSDGAVVVGWASNAGGTIRAVRWTTNDQWQTTNKLDLGTLPGGSTAWARAVSADGSVVVGFSSKTGSTSQAVRWTSNDQWVTTIKTDLGSLGGTQSDAWAVSADGTAIAGAAYINGSAQRAFRWTATSGMVNLGRLGNDSNSQAWGISEDGRVVVGWSGSSVFGTTRGFRWTAQTGMQTVEDWLRAGGVAVAADLTRYATATNADGSVVVGQTQGNAAFIARLSPIGSGLVSVADLQASLYTVQRAWGMVNMGTDLILQGLHGQPLDYRIHAGKYATWVAGDWGVNEQASRSSQLTLREFGGGVVIPWGQLNIGVGQVSTRQPAISSDRLTTDGNYVFAEMLVSMPAQIWASLAGFAYRGDALIERSYLNAGVPGASIGQPALRTSVVRARLEWDRGWQFARQSLSPYLELGLSQTKLQAYSESGGGFPARFDGFSQRDLDARLGLRYAWLWQSGWKLQGIVEHVHRFRRHGPDMSGGLIGLFDFALPGLEQKQDWLRAGLGFECQQGPVTANVMLNMASPKGASNAWLNARLSIAF